MFIVIHQFPDSSISSLINSLIPHLPHWPKVLAYSDTPIIIIIGIMILIGILITTRSAVHPSESLLRDLLLKI
jgi:hypothetical protein